MSARLRLNAPWLENSVRQDCDISHSTRETTSSCADRHVRIRRPIIILLLLCVLVWFMALYNTDYCGQTWQDDLTQTVGCQFFE